MMNKICLVCKDVEYLSPLDEEQFFGWLNKIECIEEISGVGDSIKIALASKVNDESLREIIALFYRYEVDMTQLQTLLTKTNRHWFFENKEAYWHSVVFKKNNP